MNTLTNLDITMIGIYFVVTLIIGLGFKSKIKSTLDYYVAGRSLGVFVLMSTVCASIIGGSAMIGRGGIMYTQGLVGIFLAVPYLLGTYAFTVMAGRIHDVGARHDLASIPDLMGYRFGNRVRYVVSALIAFSMMATVAAQISAFATILRMFGDIDFHTAAWIALGMLILYTSVSGLYGVVYTDVLQFLVLIVAVYIILPVEGVIAAGGIGNIMRSVPPELLRLNFHPEIVGWIFANLIFTFAAADMWQRAFAAKSAGAATKGMLLGNTIYGLTIVITAFISLSAVVLYPNIVAEKGTADAAVPTMVIRLLPSGLLGLVVAGMVAVIMSTADTVLLVSVQSVVRDIIGNACPKMTDGQELKLTRLFTVLLGFGALAVSLYIDGVYRVLMFAYTFYAASVGVPAVLALYWRKATAPGMLAGVAAGFATSTAWGMLGRPWGLSEALVGAAVCGIFVVGVSLLTHARSPSRMVDRGHPQKEKSRRFSAGEALLAE
ncbi:MAG: sodium:solute symporter family protein [Planctomycetota bacterium]|jgi:SSS family solute:Na+ symporter|nr:sodium:solute symporter family protein [Planctomycetota bacterium]